MTALFVWLLGCGAFVVYSVGVYGYRRFIRHERITFLEVLIGDGQY